MIAIINYAAGNLRSVARALDFLKVPHRVTRSRREIARASGLIFPGVGTASTAFQVLRKAQLLAVIQEQLKENKPFLGICLGHQILLEFSEEGNTQGLGFLKGKTRKLKKRPGICVPQIGWNAVDFRKPTPLLAKLKSGTPFYFLHSYAGFPQQTSVVYATFTHGQKLPAVIAKGQVFGVQFHPEKSGPAGLQVLRNFADLAV